MPDQKYSGKKFEYLMKDEEIIVSGAEETRDEPQVFKIPSDWVDTPHLRIRFNAADGKLYLASFGEKTIINENEVAAKQYQFAGMDGIADQLKNHVERNCWN